MSNNRLIGVFVQTSGTFVLLHHDDDLTTAHAGYSGAPGGVNNPTMEHLRNVGPIPRGRYLVGAPHRHPRLGPVAMTLWPHGHGAQGRSDFMIHGDNSRRDRSASRGCIVLDRDVRDLIANAVNDADHVGAVPFILVVR